MDYYSWLKGPIDCIYIDIYIYTHTHTHTCRALHTYVCVSLLTYDTHTRTHACKQILVSQRCNTPYRAHHDYVTTKCLHQKPWRILQEQTKKCWSASNIRRRSLSNLYHCWGKYEHGSHGRLFSRIILAVTKMHDLWQRLSQLFCSSRQLLHRQISISRTGRTTSM